MQSLKLPLRMANVSYVSGQSFMVSLHKGGKDMGLDMIFEDPKGLRFRA